MNVPNLDIRAKPITRTSIPCTLNCMYTNTDSLTNKLEELEVFLHTQNVDIAAITVTK